MDSEGPRRVGRRRAGFFLLLVGIGLTGAAAVLLLRRSEPAVVVEPAPRAQVLLRETQSAASPAAREKEPSKRETPGWTVVGRVLKVDRPASGVVVALTAQKAGTLEAEAVLRTETAVDGRFELLGAPGEVPLRIAIDDPASAPVVFTIQLNPPDGQERMDLGDIQLPEAAPFVVRLVDSKGTPLGGGQVRLNLQGTISSGSVTSFDLPAQESQEQEVGEYVFDRAPRGHVEVEAEVHGYAIKSEEVDLPRNEPLLLRLNLGFRIGGTVRGVDGTPIQGAAVEIRGSNDLPFETRTGASGQFLLDTLSSRLEYSVSASAEGYATTTREDVMAGNEDLDLRLFREATVSGQVLSAADKSPIKGANVTLNSDGDHLRTESDPAGRFEFGKLPPGSYRIYASHDDLSPTVLESVELEEGEKVQDLIVALETGFSMTGRVVEKVTGKPIAGASVSARLAIGEQSPLHRDVKTRPDGEFVVPGLPRGELTLLVQANGFVRVALPPVHLVERAESCTIELSRGGTIEGKVLKPDGDPASGAGVYLTFPNGAPHEVRMLVAEGSNVTTGVSGAYRIDGLVPYDGYTLHAWDSRFLPAEMDGVAIGGGETVAGVDLHLRRGGVIRGTVLYSPGNGKAEVFVSARGRGAAKDEYSMMEEDGSFEISPLQDGSYTVEVSAPGVIPPEAKEVSVVSGGTVEGVDFTFPKGLLLAGKVIDDDDNAIADCDLYISATWGKGYCRTEEDGRFSLSGLRAGPVTIEPEEIYGFEGRGLRTIVPAHEVVIRLVRWGRITGRVSAAGRSSFPRGEIHRFIWRNYWIDDEGRSVGIDATGRFNAPCPTGEIGLVVSVPGFANAGLEISVQSGQAREVVVPIVPAGTIQGTVVREDSAEPIGDALVRAVNSAGHWLPSRDVEETKSSGHFSLDSLPEGPVSLIVTHKQYATARSGPVVVRAGETAEVQIALRPSWGIRGSVSSVGRQWAGAEITACGFFAGGAEAKTVTGNDGLYELEGLPPGKYELRAKAQTHDGRSVVMQRTIAVAESSFQEVEFSLEEIRLTVRVKRAGTLVEGVPVAASISTMWRHEAIGGEETAPGKHVFNLRGPGTYLLSAGDEDTTRIEKEITVAEGVNDLSVDLELPPE